MPSKSKKRRRGHGTPASAATAAVREQKAVAAPRRTPQTMQERMKAKLAGAHFRFLNEKMYSTTASDAFEMVQAKPSLFDAYHAGFREQVEKWPTKPVDIIAGYINNQLKLDKSNDVADIGCGDAELATMLSCTTHSFDLVSHNSRVVAANMTSLPLGERSVDVVVFCLAMMGTDYAAGVVEACRVLKPGGTLLMAEVKSRFVGTAQREMKQFLAALGFAKVEPLHDNTMFFVWAARRTTDVTEQQAAQMLKLAPTLKACQYKKR